MRRLVVAALAAGCSVTAQAQLTGGVTGAVGATTGTVGTAVGAGASAGADTGTASGTMGTTRGSIDGTARPVGRGAARTATKTPMVNAGSSVHVARGTRCYDGTDYYDPYRGDGYYYCETSGPSARVKVDDNRF